MARREGACYPLVHGFSRSRPCETFLGTDRQGSGKGNSRDEAATYLVGLADGSRFEVA